MKNWAPYCHCNTPMNNDTFMCSSVLHRVSMHYFNFMHIISTSYVLQLRCIENTQFLCNNICFCLSFTFSVYCTFFVTYSSPCVMHSHTRSPSQKACRLGDISIPTSFRGDAQYYWLMNAFHIDVLHTFFMHLTCLLVFNS